MNTKPAVSMPMATIAAAIIVACTTSPQVRGQTEQLDPANMPRVATIDEHFQSYNIEMVEVIGGQFWKPYGSQKSDTTKRSSSLQGSASAPSGMNPNMYEYRPPIDLSNPRLRRLAAALSPAYVRVSGTWANSVFFANSDTPPAKAPPGYSGVLTRKEWKDVIDFSHAINAPIVTSFTTSSGPRNAEGVWTSKEANQWLAYTKSIGGRNRCRRIHERTYVRCHGRRPKRLQCRGFRP